MDRRYLTPIAILAMAVLAAFLVACQGPAGAQGPPGRQGSPGEPASAAIPAYAGSESCGTCHEEIYDVFVKSGHAWKLNPVVDGQPPDYPFTEVLSPPEGYGWDDILYVIGGYNWKARFIDQDGFIITGDADATTQYNFPNVVTGSDGGWVAYHAGEETPYDCGPCHTTGYRPEGNQDDLPGLIGTWTEPGVTCEECHGPGSLHSDEPYLVKLEVERDSAQCGECHLRGSPEGVNAKGGFIEHHEQYEELFQSKHLALDCVSCHDPHLGVIQLRQAGEPTTRTECENCHFEQAQYQSAANHETYGVDCIDCHMPRVTKSATGNAERFTGDIRTHIMAIDPHQTGQFTEDGSEALSQLSVDFACRHCHVVGGGATPRTDDELQTEAAGYHDQL